MLEELTWLDEKSMACLFSKYSEDDLRKVIKWLDNQPPETYTRVNQVLTKEINKRAAEYYESLNRGEWI